MEPPAHSNITEYSSLSLQGCATAALWIGYQEGRLHVQLTCDLSPGTEDFPAATEKTAQLFHDGKLLWTLIQTNLIFFFFKHCRVSSFELT